MQDLKYWQQKIQEKRKGSNFRDAAKEFTSWFPLVFSRNNGYISRFPDSERVKTTSIEDFELNRDDLLKQGHDYDFGKGFFENFQELWLSINLPRLIHYGTNENASFVDTAANIRNSYMSSIVVLGSENVFYSHIVRSNVVNCFNSLYVIENSENIYNCSGIISSYNIYFSKYIKNSNNIWCSSNLTGCSECILCDNLENCSYYIENKKYNKEEYHLEKRKILSDKTKFTSHYESLENIGKNHGSIDTSGSFALDCENVEHISYAYNVKNSKNGLFLGAEVGNTDMYDVFVAGAGGGDNLYGVINAGGGPSHLYLSSHIGWASFNLYYCYLLESCSYCIGCIGLKNKSYCIFNKQYSKEDWYKLADKIFSQMDEAGILGDFFPGSMSPFYFNDSMGSLLGNFKRDEVIQEGFMWRDEEIKVDIPEGSDIIKASNLNEYQGYDSEGSWRINPEILNKVIVDEKGNYYRIVQMEYDFLVKHALPLPEIHWLDRMKLNFGV